jgi:glycosyltransferase involved in cell wall biosynthesis
MEPTAGMSPREKATSGRRILLVGDIREGRPPETGEQVKNQLLSSFLRQRHRLDTIDTEHWKRRPWVVPRLFWSVFAGGYDTIILSASSGSVHRLLRILSISPRTLARTLYLVVGGYLPTGIREGRFKATTYAGLKAIVLQGEGLRKELAGLGIASPLHVMPNSKPLPRLHGDAGRYAGSVVRFLFLGRIAEPKGTITIFEALEDPLLRDRADSFSVDFYGRLEEGHRERFLAELGRHGNCAYKGYIDVTHEPDRSYAAFAGYHAMLFPTHWMGEGFPGVVIDAYVAGLPVIASDWNMNREVVEDGRTGRIIPPKNPVALAAAMASVLDDPGSWALMSEACHMAVRDYDAEKVLASYLEPLL